MPSLWIAPALALLIGMALPGAAEPAKPSVLDLQALIQRLIADDPIKTNRSAPRKAAKELRVQANQLHRSVAPFITGLSGSTAFALRHNLPNPQPVGTLRLDLPESNTPPGSLSVTDLRIILSQLAIQTGANGHLLLLQAQATNTPDAIVLHGGTWHLPDILAALPQNEHSVLQYHNGIWTLAQPLVIWGDAHLALTPGDTLTLATQTGAFLLNFGRFSLRSTNLQASRLPNTNTPQFQPFILTTAAGHFDARNSSFNNLGLKNAPGFEGVSIFSSPMFAPAARHNLSDNLFQNGTTLHLNQTRGSQITGNLFFATRDTALRLSGTRNTAVVNNLFHSTRQGASLRVTAGSTGVNIHGNIFQNGANVGLRLDRGADHARMTDNLFLGQGGAGLVIVKSACNQIFGNIFARNGGPGLSVENSVGTAIHGNGFLFNHGAGLWLHRQNRTARTQMIGNLLTGNKTGVKGANTGQFYMLGNDLTAQLPRRFAGDLMLSQPNSSTPILPLPCPNDGDI